MILEYDNVGARPPPCPSSVMLTVEQGTYFRLPNKYTYNKVHQGCSNTILQHKYE